MGEKAKETSKETVKGMAQFVPDSRFRLLGKDAWIITIGWIGFFVLMMSVAYVFGKGDPKEYTYVLGFPLWFVLCICIQLVIMGVTIYMLSRRFCDVPLDADDPEYDYGEDE